MSAPLVKLPVRVTPAEAASLKNEAAKAGVSIAAYVRERLGLAALHWGAPAGNRNNPHGRKGRPKGDTMSKITFHVPRRNQGQIVTVSYAQVWNENEDQCFVLRRTSDASDGSVLFDVSPAADDDEGNYWDDEPGNEEWRALTEDEAAAYAR